MQPHTCPHFLPKKDMILRWPAPLPPPLPLAPPPLPFPAPPLPEARPPFFAAAVPPLAGEGDWEGWADGALAPPGALPAAPLLAAAWLPGALAPPAHSWRTRRRHQHGAPGDAAERVRLNKRGMGPCDRTCNQHCCSQRPSTPLASPDAQPLPTCADSAHTLALAGAAGAGAAAGLPAPSSSHTVSVTSSPSSRITVRCTRRRCAPARRQNYGI